MTNRVRKGMWPLAAAMVVLFVAGGPLGAEQTQAVSQDRQSSEFIEGRLLTLRKELEGYKNFLKDGQVLLTFFDIVIRNYSDFKSTFDIYIANCMSQESEYEKMVKANDPFKHRFWPAIQRCKSDRAGFNNDLRRFGKEIEQITVDIDIIKLNVDRMKGQIDKQETEFELFSKQKSLRNNLEKMIDDTKNFKKPSY